MLLVYDDDSQRRKWCKKCRTWSDHHRNFSVFCAFKLVIPLPGRVYFPGPECDPMDQAFACLYLASKMGRHVKGQVLQVCNGAFL